MKNNSFLHAPWTRHLYRAYRSFIGDNRYTPIGNQRNPIKNPLRRCILKERKYVHLQQILNQEHCRLMQDLMKSQVELAEKLKEAMPYELKIIEIRKSLAGLVSHKSTR